MDGLFLPPSSIPQPWPGIVVLHGSDGRGPQHERVGLDLAARGYAATVPRWFGSPGRYDWADLRLADLVGFRDELASAPGVDPARLGWLGFSRGGGLAVVSAALVPGARAVVDFFGLTRWKGGLAELPHLPLDPSDPLAVVAGLPCPVLALHGDADHVVPVEDTRRLAEACHRFGVPHETIIYPGVGHSFVWPGNPLYRPGPAHDAWIRVYAYFEGTLPRQAVCLTRPPQAAVGKAQQKGGSR